MRSVDQGAKGEQTVEMGGDLIGKRGVTVGGHAQQEFGAVVSVHGLFLSG